MRESSPELVYAVAQRIKALRQVRGLTQDAVAEALGIAVKNVQRLEAGRQNLTLKTLASVADVLDVEPYELLKAGPVSLPDADVSLKRALRGLTRLGHRVFAGDDPPPRGAIPVMSLQAAASSFGGTRSVEVSAWLQLKGARKDLATGRFVAQVAGRSMSPTVPSGALVLFKGPVVGPLEGRVVVAEWRDYADPETGGAYVLKRVGSVEQRPRGGLQLHLRSDNPDFPPLLVDAKDSLELRIVAELERVLWPARK
ncbi:MAG TPA: LexA family transcriptional regulator [Polyangiaceae bacterium]|nr:LexA family transcriptional regulator [Polyangiaceae bacterium]